MWYFLKGETLNFMNILAELCFSKAFYFFNIIENDTENVKI